tara:strand:- start:4696 stop:4890 length:195 start_codon:yes stop_codon:yes gene_type:complete
VKIETLIQRLEAEQIKLASEALAQPSGRELFDYGRAVGMYAGLEHAKRTILAAVNERNLKDNIL